MDFWFIDVFYLIYDGTQLLDDKGSHTSVSENFEIQKSVWKEVEENFF